MQQTYGHYKSQQSRVVNNSLTDGCDSGDGYDDRLTAVFDSNGKCEYVIISVRLAGLLAECSSVAKNFNVAIFLDTMINVKLCMMVVLIELYQYIPLLVILTVFPGHISVKQF